MNLKNILLVGAAVAALGLASAPAEAGVDTIVANQWYGATFPSTAPGVLSGFQDVVGTNGPLLTGTGSSVSAGTSPWVITLTYGGTLTATDVEASGDAFEFFNGVTPLGFTSTPTNGDTGCADDIGCALADSNYSSGTFVLPSGTIDLNGLMTTSSGTGPGDVYFIVQAYTSAQNDAPEPATLTVLGIGLAGLGALRRRRKSR